MIYLDASVALAQLLSENRRPADAFWENALISSRLLEYELWTRLNGRGLAVTHGPAAQRLIARVSFVELSRLVLDRIVDGLESPLRTLDALHLATLLYLRETREPVSLASYDERLLKAARRLSLPILELD